MLGPEGTPPDRLFRFPEGTSIPHGSRLLLFGGGSPGAFPCPVFVAGGRIGKGLSANGATVVLIDPVGPDTLIRVSYPLAHARSRGQGEPPRIHLPVWEESHSSFILTYRDGVASPRVGIGQP